MNTIKLNTIGEVPIKKGGASGGGGGNYVYYKRVWRGEGSPQYGFFLTELATLQKIVTCYQVTITNRVSGFVWEAEGERYQEIICPAVAIDFEQELYIGDLGGYVKPKDFMSRDIPNFKECSKEEFYAINDNIFYLGADNIQEQLQFEPGMTWGEWLESPYAESLISYSNIKEENGVLCITNGFGGLQQIFKYSSNENRDLIYEKISKSSIIDSHFYNATIGWD